MITKETLGNIENVTIASFGFGTMRVTSGEAQDKTFKGLFLGDTDTPKPIGELGPPAPTTKKSNSTATSF